VIAWRQELGDADVVLPPVAHAEFVAARSGRTVGAFRVRDGELLWRTEVGSYEDEGILVATDQALVVVTADENEARIMALNWASGRDLWTAAVPGVPARRAASSDGTDVQLLTATGSTTFVHDLDSGTGEVRWSAEVPPSCTVVLARDRQTLLGSRDLLGDGSGLYRLSTDSLGIERLLSNDVWSLHRGDVVDIASVGDYGSEDRFIIALDPVSGEPGWRQPAMTELVAVDGGEVACMEEAGSEQLVVLRDALSGNELWRAEPQDFFCAGMMFFTGDAVGVADVMGVWFADRTTGADLGRVSIDMSATAVCMTPAGIVLALGHGLACLRPE
jgi:outer membrane protein assembly factor BamB